MTSVSKLVVDFANCGPGLAPYRRLLYYNTYKSISMNYRGEREAFFFFVQSLIKFHWHTSSNLILVVLSSPPRSGDSDLQLHETAKLSCINSDVTNQSCSPHASAFPSHGRPTVHHSQAEVGPDLPMG